MSDDLQNAGAVRLERDALREQVSMLQEHVRTLQARLDARARDLGAFTQSTCSGIKALEQDRNDLTADLEKAYACIDRLQQAVETHDQEQDTLSRALLWLSRFVHTDSAWPPHVLAGYSLAAKRRDQTQTKTKTEEPA